MKQGPPETPSIEYPPFEIEMLDDVGLFMYSTGPVMDVK